MGSINGWGVCNAVMVIVICLASGRYGAARRRAGRPVTGRETVTIALIAGALAFLTVSLPAVFNRNGGVTNFQVLERLIAVIALALAPLAVWLLIRLLTRFAVNVKKPARTDPGQPHRHAVHPLD
jgi:uncharacterized membrane protein